MNKRYFVLALLLLALPAARLFAQGGDAVEEGAGGDDGSGDSDGGGSSGGSSVSGGGSSADGDGSSGEWRDDGNWWWTEEPGDENCEPDTSPPWLKFDVLPYDDAVDCPDAVPAAPTVDAWDFCGQAGISSSTVTNRNAADLPVSVVRTWTATDAAGISSRWKQVIKIRDTEYPVIDVKSEIEVKAGANGRAKMPDFSDRARDDFGCPHVTQTPGPGGEYSIGERQPVSLVAEDQCGRKATNIFTVIFSCGGCCPGSCSAGSGTPKNACVSLSISLGRLDNGSPAGNLELFAQRPSSRIFSPEVLRYDRQGTGAQTTRDANGWLRQIRSADVLVDIVTNNGYQFSYDIRFYSPADWGSPDESGLYVPSGPAHLSWQVYAPQTLVFGGKTVANSNRVMLSKVAGGEETRYEYLFDEARQGWRLTSGIRFHHANTNRSYFWDHGLMVESRSSSTDGATRTETYAVAVSTSAPVAYREVHEYRQFPWGEAWIKSVQGEGNSALTTERGYYEDPLQPSRYARLAWERQPDGNFAWYDYDDQGRVAMEARAWKDVDVPVLESNALMAAAAVTLYAYSPVDAADAGIARPRNPRTITALAGNQVVSKTFFSYVAGANGEIEEIKEECATPAAAFGAAGNRRTRTTFYSDAEELWPGAVKSVEYPDGRRDRYVMERGDYGDGESEPGTFTVGSGDYIRTTEIHGTVLHPEKSGKTTREVSVRRVLGEEVLRETYVFGGYGYRRVDWTVRNYDDRGHLISEKFANGLARTSQWSDCCGKESDVDVDGTRTFYEYDALGRLATRTKAGVPNVSSATDPGYPEQPDIVATNVYDGAGNVVKEIQKALLIQSSAGGVTREIVKGKTFSRASYDLAGRQVESRDTSGLQTRYEYSEGGRSVTVVRPGGATEITENFPDGRIKSVTGTGVVPRFYDYGVDPDGSQWTLVRTGRPDSPMWEKTTTDMLGRTVREEKPGFGGVLLTTTCDYNDKGQLATNRTWAGESADVPIQPAAFYEYDELGDQIRTIQDVNGNGTVDLDGPDRISETQSRIATLSGERWRETVSKVYPTDGSSNSVAVSVQRRSMAGEGSGYSPLKSESVDVRGNTTMTTIAVDPAQRIVTTTIDSPDSTVDAVTIVRNGLVHSTRPSIWRDPTYFAYDGLGRQIMVTDPRTGEHLAKYNDRGQVEGTSDAAGNWTTNVYDPNSGLQTEIRQYGRVVNTAYDLQGRPTSVWGATYPVSYEYDDYGRMSAMKTWRDTNAEPDVTRWFYDEATGLLTNKVYADGNGTSYEYDAAGRLTRRIWVRGVATDYAYDALGQLTNIDYSDDTPDVSFTYDRMGRQVEVTDALGTRTNLYDPATFDLATEQLPDGQVLARSYDRFGRPAGIALDEGYQVAYAYDDASRFMAITSVVNAATTAVKYDYLAQSDLVSGWSVREPSKSPVLAVTRRYEPWRDLVVAIVATNSAGYVAQYTYANDRLGRRFARNDSIGDTKVVNSFGYNARSELDVAVMGTNQFGYQYDAIGNRQAAIANVSTNVYQANALNQYASVLPSAGTPAYDADGNMTFDGTLSYFWDAENRLTEVRSNDAVVVQNAYDYLGRRVRKATATATNTFVYDGWNLLREKSVSGGTSTTNSYLWGLDLSGTLQGAGGVGGLLCRIEGRVGSPSRPLFSFSDANGNVMGLVGTNGAIAARYAYDPYGNLTAISGDQAQANSFRFSSKYCDGEIGLYYYGYRFYSPSMGRWISQDPIQEFPSYTFVWNMPLSMYDVLGLWGDDVHNGGTRGWARAAGMPNSGADLIGKWDAKVDQIYNPGNISEDTWAWHFDRSIGGKDSRLKLFEQYFQGAKDSCNWRAYNQDDAQGAAISLGMSLHPLQDWVAHGDFNRRRKDEAWQIFGWKWSEKRHYWHNWDSPLIMANSTGQPDNPGMDAISADGRPTIDVLRLGTKLTNGDQTYWAVFKPGSARINLTQQKTMTYLWEFMDFVRVNSNPCGKCKKLFLP